LGIKEPPGWAAFLFGASEGRIPQGQKPRSILEGLRGAEAPLFHGISGIPSSYSEFVLFIVRIVQAAQLSFFAEARRRGWKPRPFKTIS